MHTKRHIDKLEKVVNCELEINNPIELYKSIYVDLDKKIKRIIKRYPGVEVYFNPLPKPIDAKLDENEIETMRFLSGRDIDVAYKYLKHSNFLTLRYPNGYEKQIPAIRMGWKIILKNPEPVIKERTKHVLKPYITKEGIVQSWNHPNVNLKYNKHAANSKNSEASKYFNLIDRKNIEETVFYEGIGYIQYAKPTKTMFLYAAFNENIGIAKTSKTNICKIQADKVKSDDIGNVSIHGFPITKQELIRDLGKRAKIVLKNTYSII